MNFKTTVALLVLVLVAGAVWLFYPKSTTESATDGTQPKPEALAYVFEPQPKDSEITRIELERPGKDKLVFERAGDEDAKPPAMAGAEEWRMVAPTTGPTEGWQVSGSLLRPIASAQSRSRFEAGAQDELTAVDAGLEPPLATVTLTDKAGKAYKLEVGKKAAMSSDTYARIAGEKTIHLVSGDLKTSVEKTARDFRSKRLLKYLPDEVVQVQLEHEGKAYDLTKSASGEWVFNAPFRALADGTKLRDKLLTPASYLQAAEIIDTAPAAAFGSPYLTLAVTTEKKPTPPATTQPAESQPEQAAVRETHKLIIGGVADLKSEKRFVQTGDGATVALVPQTSLAPLIPDVAALRDPRITRVKASELTALTLTADGQTAELKRTGAGWEGMGDLAALDQEAVRELVDGLASLSATNYIDQPQDDATYGLDQPRVTITATAQGEVAPLSLQIGKLTESGRNAYVRRAGEQTVYVTTATQLEAVAVPPLALRSREILTFAPEKLTSVTVDRGQTHYELVRAGAGWKLAAPADAPLDEAGARTLTTDLSRLRAKRVVEKGTGERFGLNEPVVTIRVQVAPDTPAPAAPAASAPAAAAATAPAGAEFADLGAASTAPTTPGQPAADQPATHVLRVARHEGKTYARRDDQPYVYELDDTLFPVLTAELIDPRLFAFDGAEIVYLKIAVPGDAQPQGGAPLEFTREEGVWHYSADRFLELDQKKLDEFARDVAQMRAERWLEYRNADFAAAGLEQDPATVTIRLKDNREFELRMVPETPGQPPKLGGLVAEQRTLLLRSADVEKLTRALDAYVKTETKDNPTAVRPPPPPGIEPLEPLPEGQ
ncbi:MAG: DUF4340 domain-containing protein [Planctomycetota bacterium]